MIQAKGKKYLDLIGESTFLKYYNIFGKYQFDTSPEAIQSIVSELKRTMNYGMRIQWK